MSKYFYLIPLFFIHFLALSQDLAPSFEEAKRIAREDEKAIILVFSGSDWCGPCIKLDNEIWQSKVFTAYAKDHYVMIRADFPKKKANKLPKPQQEINNWLAAKYNPQGYFPFVLVFNSQAQLVGKTGYKAMTAQEYISHLDAFLE